MCVLDWVYKSWLRTRDWFNFSGSIQDWFILRYVYNFWTTQNSMTLRRASTKSLHGFELNFSADLVRCNAPSTSNARSGALFTLMLLTNGFVDWAQRIYILATTLPKSASIATLSTTDESVKLVGHDTVGNVVRSCGRVSSAIANPLEGWSVQAAGPSRGHFPPGQQPRHSIELSGANMIQSELSTLRTRHKATDLLMRKVLLLVWRS